MMSIFKEPFNYLPLVSFRQNRFVLNKVFVLGAGIVDKSEEMAACCLRAPELLILGESKFGDVEVMCEAGI